MQISIRHATPHDAAGVSLILQEAATWLKNLGIPLWQPNDLSEKAIADDVLAGLFFIAIGDGEPAGTMKFQLEDPLFWPDLPPGESAFIHRLAVRRRFAGGAVSLQMLHWAVERTRQFERPFLRLDCDAARPRLRAVYERFGFEYHSDRQVGPYRVARYQYAVGA